MFVIVYINKKFYYCSFKNNFVIICVKSNKNITFNNISFVCLPKRPLQPNEQDLKFKVDGNEIAIRVNNTVFNKLEHNRNFIIKGNKIKYIQEFDDVEESYLKYLDINTELHDIINQYKFNCIDRNQFVFNLIKYINNNQNKTYLNKFRILEEVVKCVVDYYGHYFGDENVKIESLFYKYGFKNGFNPKQYFRGINPKHTKNISTTPIEETFLEEFKTIPNLRPHIILYEMYGNKNILVNVLINFINEYQRYCYMNKTMSFDEFVKLALTYCGLFTDAANDVNSANIKNLFIKYHVDSKFNPTEYFNGFNNEVDDEIKFEINEHALYKICYEIPELKTHIIHYLKYGRVGTFIGVLTNFIYDSQLMMYVNDEYTMNEFCMFVIEFCNFVGNIKFKSENIVDCINELFEMYEINDKFEPLKLETEHDNNIEPILNLVNHINGVKEIINTIEHDTDNDEVKYCNIVLYLIDNILNNANVWDSNNCWIIKEILRKVFVYMFIHKFGENGYPEEWAEEDTKRRENGFTGPIPFNLTNDTDTDLIQQLLFYVPYIYGDEPERMITNKKDDAEYFSQVIEMTKLNNCMVDEVREIFENTKF